MTPRPVPSTTSGRISSRARTPHRSARSGSTVRRTNPDRPVPPRGSPGEARPAWRGLGVAALVAALTAACSTGEAENVPNAEASEPVSSAPAPSAAPACAPDDAGIVLPDGFCAVLAYEGGVRLRHIDVRADGDVFVARPPARRGEGSGGVLALRDTDGDGVFDVEERWGEAGGNEVILDGEDLYLTANGVELHRYTVPEGSLTPTAGPEVVISDFPQQRSHRAKSVALGHDGAIYVNVGAPSNACQREPRTAGSPGLDPCPQLERQAGIWRFDSRRAGQTQADGSRFATGLRNVVALRVHPATGQLFGLQHGRDQLHQLFPEMYTVEENAELPSEEFVAIDEGDDFGWPYCYHDWQREVKLLGPEYGGDEETVGRCAQAEDPLIGFPGHWAPNDLEFYTGSHFPERYRNGAFIAFHGSWNRAPLPQDGYNVVFAPFEDGRPTGEWEVFASGFRAEEGSEEPGARPVGVAMAPDGSLYVVDSSRGRIWRIFHEGS